MAIYMPKIIKSGAHLTKSWQTQVGSFFGTPCSISRWGTVLDHACDNCKIVEFY